MPRLAHCGALLVDRPTHDHAQLCAVLLPPRAGAQQLPVMPMSTRPNTRVIAAIPPSGCAIFRGKHDR